MNLDPAQLYIGKLKASASDRWLSLSQNDRRRHMYVIGQTGSGKSTLLSNCMLQDIWSEQASELLIGVEFGVNDSVSAGPFSAGIVGTLWETVSQAVMNALVQGQGNLAAADMRTNQALVDAVAGEDTIEDENQDSFDDDADSQMDDDELWELSYEEDEDDDSEGSVTLLYGDEDFEEEEIYDE